MLRKITKIVFALSGTLLALALVMALSLGVWVMTGPKSLTKLLPYISASLNPANSPYSVKIDDAVVYWDGWSEPIDFRLRGVGISTQREGAELIRLNEVSVGLDMPSLLRFKVVAETIILRNAKMRFFREDDGQFYVGIGEAANQRVPLAMLLAGMSGEGSSDDNDALIGNIRLIAIEHAQLSFGSPEQVALFDAQDANLRIRREDNAIHAELAIALNYNEKPSQIRGALRLANRQDMIVAKVELLDVSPHIFAKLAPEVPELAMLELPLSGWSDVAIDNAGNVTLVDFRLQSDGGTFTHDTHFAEPLAISQAALEGQMRDNFRQLVLKKGELHFDKSSLSVNGIAQRHEAGWTYDAAALALNMPVNDLYKYWPKSLANTSYQWVTTHIREGMVPKAEARMKLTPEQLGQPFPASALDIKIEAQGVQVEYLPGHPKVMDVKGIVMFDGKGMTITSQQGKMLGGSVLKDAWLHIPELASTTPKMDITLAIEAPASDVATYIGIPELGFAEPLGLDPATIQGNATGKMEFHFLLPTEESENDDSQLKFLIDADITGGVQPAFMGDMNLTAAEGKLTITHETLDFNGTMAISNAPLAVSLTHYFSPREYQTEYRANGLLAAPQLSAFGVPDMPFLLGNVGLDAHIRRSPDKSNVKATADLAQVAVNVSEIGLTKKAGSKAVLELDADLAGGALMLKSFALTGEEIRARGSAIVGDEMSKLQSLRLDQLEYGDNNLALAVTAQGSGYVVRAKGPSLDLKPVFGDDDDALAAEAVEAEEESKLPFDIDFHGEFDWIVIGKERELRRVNARLLCTTQFCESADVRGITGQSNEFVYQIKRVDGIRQLNFTSQNAGSFLKAMNVFDNMTGGLLSLRGRFEDTQPQRPFVGTLHVSEHTITNAPVLAKIASLLSVSGIGDALGGKGISFKEITSDIGYSKGVATLKNGKAYGPSLGITVEDGRINTNRKTVAVTGTFVPSYTLNTVLDNIPVIGGALMGGKGEGVFAATYKVEGKYPDDTNVSVNPLSMLAPGFLRNIFGGAGKVPPPATQAPAPPAAN